jgi:hypothetical protein
MDEASATSRDVQRMAEEVRTRTAGQNLEEAENETGWPTSGA